MRWIRDASKSTWEPRAESRKQFRSEDANVFYRLCKEPDHEPTLDRSGENGISVGKGDLDLSAKTASVSFNRDFDISSDRTLTLVAGQKFKVWFTWGVFDSAGDKRASRVIGQRSEKDGMDWLI